MEINNTQLEENKEEVVFKIKDLNLFYSNKQALKNININIYKNKVTALIGPSGCGKSTFIRCLNRMNDLNDECKITGLIEYEGQDIKDMNTILLRTKVGMVFQQPNPFPMSIYDNIAYGPRCQGLKNRATLDEIVKVSKDNSDAFEQACGTPDIPIILTCVQKSYELTGSVVGEVEISATRGMTGEFEVHATDGTGIRET